VEDQRTTRWDQIAGLLQGRTGLMPMDGIDSVYQHLVERRDGGGQALRVRSFLFLQGPISDFNDRLGRALIARGTASTASTCTSAISCFGDCRPPTFAAASMSGADLSVTFWTRMP